MNAVDTSGLLLVDKPAGCTSHDVVQQARRALRERRIGHCGTLDPAATGLLLLTVGRATRLTRFLIRAPKVYEGMMRFGVCTDTYDTEGQVTATAPVAGLTMERLHAEMERFRGEYQQVPPPFCAKKTGGRKYYELAREGLEVPREPSQVEVYEFVPLGSELSGDTLSFRLACSSGTYARSIVHDLGQRLGCGAHLFGLRRQKIGHFGLEHAVELGRLREMGGLSELGAAWIPFDEIRLPFTELATDATQERRILNGQTVVLSELAADEGDWVKLVNQQRRFIAVGTVTERFGDRGVGVIQPRIVFS
ncbi:MAG TPA: tRNA pseudouridine(55) synthase TruB [Thermoanaerobaculia bacterium]|nr:tRNA pseudouridine(55) synthase TruB [Thermoanaerobaculia bacterium]